MKEIIINHYKEIIITFSIILVFVLVFYFYFYSSKENFENFPLGSKSGFGYEQMTLSRPIFSNFYPRELGSDFKLNDYLRKLKMQRNAPTLYNGFQLPSYSLSNPYPNDTSKTFNGYTQFSAGKATLTPIIIIPTIGASKIYAKWSKQNDNSYVKKLDAYGNFETTDRWKCKDTQSEWTQLWSPQKNVSGLVDYCWSNNIKTDISNNYITNTQGTITTTNDIGQIDFDSPYYNVLIKALYTLGYVEGFNLFGANYDFRKISTDENYFVNSLKSLVDNLNGPVILLGHGFGACVANNFLNNMPNMWRQNKIKSFISVSGTFTGCPKALRVLISGEKLPNNSESKIIQKTTLNYDSLYLMTPHPALYRNSVLITQNKMNMSSEDIPTISQKIGSGSAMLSSVQNYRNKMLADANVPTYVFIGSGITTESGYTYSSFTDNPLQVYKNYNGDGTVPDFSLMYPIKSWNNIVASKVYNNAEHLQILSMYEPIKDILELVQKL